MPESLFPHQQATQGRLCKEEQISLTAREGWEWEQCDGVIKGEVKQEGTAEESFPVVRQRHK